ncbi:RHS repeat-associated core domain-containing protein [Pseudomonas sp. NPDC089406]|uniref:RHS repeat-associated core domain-containing protein n=1 Tax=Pseudomonas sp. NPDC089406 TaxID=3364463 RepID=UPI00384E1D42
MFEAARVGDEIAHSNALVGMIAGTVVGGLIAAAGGIAASALFVAGLAASCIGVGVLLVGASFLVGYLTAEAATAARDSIAEAGAASSRVTGNLTTGSSNVFINGRAATMATLSQLACRDDGPTRQMAQGSSKVFINGMPASRLGDRTNCDAKVASGSGNVFIGGEAVDTLVIEPEVPPWLGKVSDLTLLLAGLLGGISGAPAKLGALARLPGIAKLLRVACRVGRVGLAASVGGILARPVDVVSGQKFLAGEQELDFTLPGHLPLRWQRYWRSGDVLGGVLGAGWNIFWESWLARGEDGVLWRAPNGDCVALPLLPAGERYYCPHQQQWFEHQPQGGWLIRDASGETWHYPELPADGRAYLQRQALPCGHALVFARHADGSLHELVDNSGLRVQCRYQQGRLAGAWLQDGTCLVQYAYDSTGQLCEVTGRGGLLLRRYTWQDGLMASHEDSRGLRCEYRWQEIDLLPRVVGYANNAGERLDIHYDFAGLRRQVHREDGASASWCVDEHGNVLAFTDFDGRTTSLAYQEGIPSVFTLPGGRSLRVEWDAFGRVLAQTDALGQRTAYQWLRLTDRVLRITHPDGSSEGYEYDDKLRLLSETDALGQVRRYAYAGAQAPAPERIIGPDGGVVRLQWTAQGLLCARTDCSGHTQRQAYDRFGQLLQVEDALGQKTRLSWSEAGQLLAIQAADGRCERFQWRGQDLLESWADAQGGVISWRYDVLGGVQSRTDRLGRVLRCQHDPRGLLLRLDNGNGGHYHFSHDAAGRLLEERRPDGTGYRLQWDDRGFACARSEFACTEQGQRLERHTQLWFDDGGQLLGHADDDAHWRYQRDACGRVLELQRTPTVKGLAIGVVQDCLAWRYDRAGQMLSEEGAQGTIEFQYDALGYLSGLKTPAGDRLQWLRYGAGHALAIAFNGEEVSSFTRDALHRERSRTLGPLTQQRSLGPDGQLSEVFSHLGDPQACLLTRQYGFDGRAYPATITDNLRGTQQFGHDAEGRLVSHALLETGQMQVFRFDAADNLLGRHDQQAYPDNRVGQVHGVVCRHDAWGNLVERRDGALYQHYRYDAGNRLLHAHGVGPQGRFEAHYQYDALGRRVAKQVRIEQGQAAQTSRVSFTWQGGRLLQEQTEQGVRRTYVYDPADAWNPLARIDQAAGGEVLARYWFHTEVNGLPLELTDQQGEVRWSGSYQPWGQLVGQVPGSHRLRSGQAPIDQPLRFAGQYQDGETGLHYTLNRYYDPGCARFVSQDPVGLLGGLNLYQYAPSPLLWIDPLGLANIRLRHYTSNKGFAGIKESGVIKASDQNSVFAVKAKGKPLSGPDAEDRFKIKRGHGRNYIEFDVDESRAVFQKNQLGVEEYKIKGDVHLDPKTTKFISRC